MEVLFKLAIVLITGWLGGKLAKLLKLPNVSGYLIAGLFLGPSFFKLIYSQDVDSFTLISEVALAIVAFSIGSEFLIKDLLKLGRAVIIITLAEVVGAVLVVFLVMFLLFRQDLVFSLVIASMSAATAPAATLVVMRHYRSDGPLTRTVLPVVALDDVFGIMVFGLALSIARIVAGSGDYSLWRMLLQPLVEILGSLTMGAFFGVILTLFAKKASDSDEILIVALAMVFAATDLSKMSGLSPLLTNIMMGAVLVNLMHNSNRVFFSLNHFTPPLYLLFFTLAGASLDLRILSGVGLIGLAYIMARAGGKYLGAWLGAKGVNAAPTVQRYLGLALLPQGGISIGLSVLVRQYLPQYSVSIITIVMFSILVYEVSGPIFAKIAISKADEIGGMDRKIE